MTEQRPSTEATAQELVITREFDAPRERVFQAWTEAERLAQWWGPKGCTIRVQSLDLRADGVFPVLLCILYLT